MLLTFQDAVERLIHYLGGQPSDAVLRDAKQACIEALRDITQVHPWTYLYTHGRIDTQASYTDGLIDYTAAGDPPHAVVLTGGTWPSWAALGVLRIGLLNYDVERRVSDTVLTLKAPQVPDDDFTAQAYGLFQSSYALPDDFHAQDVIFTPTVARRSLVYVHPREYLLETTSWGTIGDPLVYTFMANPHLGGKIAIWLAPFPTSRQALEFLYKRRPRPLVVFQEAAGTVAAVAGTATVQGSATAFAGLMVDRAVIRLSGVTRKLPTAEYGDNPAVFESRIIGVDVDTQTLTTADPIPSDFGGASYVISSFVDISVGAMEQAYLRCCEHHISMSRVMKDKPSARAQYREALEVAQCADVRNTYPRVAGPPLAVRRRLKDYPIDLTREV